MKPDCETSVTWVVLGDKDIELGEVKVYDRDHIEFVPNGHPLTPAYLKDLSKAFPYRKEL
jgi:hypothetical protein